jgi:hypothetical protein
MPDFNEYKLGDSDKLITLDSREDNQLVVTAMARQCTRTVDIISRLLDPPIFDSTDFIDAIRQLIIKNRKPKIRVIVFDPDTIVKHGHRLINLAGDISSFIEIRKAHYQHKDYNECLFIADNIGYVHRNDAERYEANVNFKDPRQSKYLMKEFDEMWEMATQDPNLRRMTM